MKNVQLHFYVYMTVINWLLCASDRSHSYVQSCLLLGKGRPISKILAIVAKLLIFLVECCTKVGNLLNKESQPSKLRSVPYRLVCNTGNPLFPFVTRFWRTLFQVSWARRCQKHTPQTIHQLVTASIIELAKHWSLQDDNIIYLESAHSRESRHYFKLSVSFTVLSSRLLCITVGFENTSITVPVVSRKSR